MSGWRMSELVSGERAGGGVCWRGARGALRTGVAGGDVVQLVGCAGAVAAVMLAGDQGRTPSGLPDVDTLGPCVHTKS